jgi:hypothetical protein
MLLLFDKFSISQNLRFVRVFFSNPQAQTQSQQADKIQIVSVKFIETCQTMFIFNPQVFSLNNLLIFQPDNNVFNIEGEQERYSLGRAHEKALTRQGPLIQTALTPSFFRIQAWNNFYRLLTSSGRHRNCNSSPRSMDTAMALNRKLQQQKTSYFLNGFFSGFRLPNQFLYSQTLF